MVYRSKKNAWLVAVVLASVVIPLLVGLYNLLSPGGNPQAGWTAFLVGVVTGAVVLWLTFPLYYEITPTALKVRCGMLIRQEIPLSAIDEVSPTRSPLSAPAWSLDRLRISYRRGSGEGFTLISPEGEEEFMRELVESGVGLEMRGGRVVRISG